jgi:tetratricopeptide (TPR) repeat protein
MAKKKNPSSSFSLEDDARAQQVFENYQQIADSLHTSTDQEQAEAALVSINNLSVGTQLALLKTLSKEHSRDSADLLLAINELSPNKDIRKEARRSLIRLQEVRIYPQWTPPARQPLIVTAPTTPLHFWKGFVTNTRATGAVQLVLCFHESESSQQARILGFFLDFMGDGVKEFFTRVDSKRSVDELAGELMNLPGVETKPCSLARGRRLLLEALAVNQEHGTIPHRDYRLNSSLIARLVLEPSDLEEEDDDLDDEDFEDELDDDEDEINLDDLDPNEVVVNFVEFWVNGDYEQAYELLSTDSPIREGLSQEDWVERREVWADEALPDELEPNFIYEREEPKSGLWLPNPLSARPPANTKVFEVGWSIVLDEAAYEDILPELPQATAVYEETDRRWFWTSYTLVQEEDKWRIQQITDEGATALSLPSAELQQRAKENDQRLEEFYEKHQASDPDSREHAGELLWRVMRGVYFRDALIKHLPQERSLYEEAVAPLILFGLYERSLVYMEPLVERFTENRAENLRGLAAIYVELSRQYDEQEDEELAAEFEERAEEALRKSLEIEDSAVAHISLAELLLDDDEGLDEAEEHLNQAKALTEDPQDEAHIELHLGQIAMEREEYDLALSHYQRVTEIQPDNAENWSNLAEAYAHLGDVTEAEANYRRAIELQPDDEDLWYDLSKLYSDNHEPDKAIEVIEEGIDANPESAVLNVYLASIYLENGNVNEAEIFLDRAEELDPELEMLPALRQLLNVTKSMQARKKPRQISGANKPQKGKKKRR